MEPEIAAKPSIELRCIGCGYLRTGLSDDDPCPECGVEWGAPIAACPRIALPMRLRSRVAEDGTITVCNRGAARATGWIGSSVAFLLLGLYMELTRSADEGRVGLVFLAFSAVAALATTAHLVTYERIVIRPGGEVTFFKRRLLRDITIKSCLDDLGLRRCRVQTLRSRQPMCGLLLAADDEVMLIAAHPDADDLEGAIKDLPETLRSRITPGWLVCSIMNRPRVLW